MLLILGAVVAAVAALADALALGGDPTSVAAQGAIGLVQLVAFLVTGVLFLVWWRHAFIRASTLDADAVEKLSPGWAIGSWFVPILNLFFPYQIAKRMWWAISLQKDPRPNPPAHFAQWWGTFLVSTCIGRGAGRVDDTELSGLLFLGSDVLAVVAAVLALRVVSTLSAPVPLPSGQELTPAA